jgi:tetratricopeptide (TPR) repeat protein
MYYISSIYTKKEGSILKFYNPGEKIKQMRRKFRVNQSELECVNVTRAFISMMESEKRNVSKATSRKLAEKFREVASRFHANLEIDDEYFSRTPAEDARYYCENELKREDTISHKELEALIKIEIEFNLEDLLADTYRMNGVMYKKEKNYMLAFENLNNALGKYKELRNGKAQAEVYCNLGYCKTKKTDYEDAIFYYKKAIYYAKEEDDNLIFFKASHSLALAYGSLGENEKCLEIIENNILNNSVQPEEHFLYNAKLMRANIYDATGKLDEAAKEFFEIVEIVRYKDEPTLGLLYTNIASYYYKTGNYDKSLRYISESQRIKTKVNKELLSSTLILKAKVVFAQGLYDEGIMLLGLAIDLAQQYKRFDNLQEAYRELVKVLETNKDWERLKESATEFLSICEDNELQDGKRYAIYKLAEVTAIQGNSDESINLLHRLDPLV